MLSILIPVYNYNIVELAREIHHQAVSSRVAFEILIVDDGSVPAFKEENRIVIQWKDVRYEELEKNIGRSKIRNKMAGMARFPWLLFLDCDSRIAGADYIASYLARCDKESVICGGRTYAEKKPEDASYYLRWQYGRKREQKSAAYRNVRPWNSFMTNNFVIAKSIFEWVAFDESIDKYGHEDTFFGFELKRKGISVIHIDNPLVHAGLETNAEFLKKTQEGISNLAMLMHQKTVYRNEMVSGIRLLRHFSWLSRFRLLAFYRLIFAGVKKQILANLMSCHPSLFFFDMYKLGILAEDTMAFAEYSRNRKKE
jgi:glycosyltransferase involved in cell wall biosynthesis